MIPVPQAADAAQNAMDAHCVGFSDSRPESGKCAACGFPFTDMPSWLRHRAEAVAAAVVAAVQGPIKAEADPVIEYLDRLERMDPSPRMKAIIAELRADRIEAQP